MQNDERDRVVTGTRGSWWWFSLATRLRCAIAVLAMVVSAAEGDLAAVAPWAFAVIVLELAADRAPDALSRRITLYLSIAVVLLTLGFALDDTRAVLPLLLVPAYRAGERHGRHAAACVPLVLGAGMAVLAWWHRDAVAMGSFLQWWALSVGLAQLGSWGRRVETERARPGTAAAREAGQLLGRLQDLTRQLPTGLDVPAVATLLLEEATALVGADRAAVLVRIGDEELSPVALTGVERVPWRDPVQSAGTLHDAWTRKRVMHDLRQPDASGRRQGSAMVAVPLADRDDELLGLLVLERTTPRPFSPEDVATVVEAADRLAPHLHAALAFTELRHVSEVAERERLAREMHDGVAQDLSALGFALDAATKRVKSVDPSTATMLVEVRAELNRTIRDIRLSISDLRSSIRSERGLGAAISSHVQSLGSASDITVTVALQESPFRLPSHHESALLRLVQDFLGDTRTRRTASSLRVELETHPPRAELRLGRVGGGDWVPDELLVASVESLGGRVQVDHDGDTVAAVVEIGGVRPVVEPVLPVGRVVPVPRLRRLKPADVAS